MQRVFYFIGELSNVRNTW